MAPPSGDQILDLSGCLRAGLLSELSEPLQQACAADALNALMALGPRQWRALRRLLSDLLAADLGERMKSETGTCLVAQSEVEMQLPARVGDYTDFYASVFHATNVGSLFRPDNPLLPNYKHVPIGYHGRASSVVVSGTEIRRPEGQTKAPDAQAPSFGPCRLLDYELEVGFFVGPGNDLGRPLPLEQAEEHIFRPVSGQRLVGARPPGLGVSAPRPLPGQEFRHHGVALGRDTRCSGSLPLCGSLARAPDWRPAARSALSAHRASATEPGAESARSRRAAQQRRRCAPRRWTRCA